MDNHKVPASFGDGTPPLTEDQIHTFERLRRVWRECDQTIRDWFITDQNVRYGHESPLFVDTVAK